MIIDPFDCPVDDTGREQVVHGSADFPIACYFNDLVQIPVLLHWHEELEAGIVTEGTAVLSIGSEQHILSAGEGFFINTGVLHAAHAASGCPCTIHSMVFHPRLIGGTGDSIFFRRYLRPLMEAPTLEWICLRDAVPWNRHALDAIRDVWEACRTEAPGYEFSVRNELSRLTWELHSHHTDHPQAMSHKSRRDAERIKLMLSFIHENYSLPITTRSIAASASVSESEALRCFRSTVGTTPIQYLKLHRLRQAAMQLLSGNDKISDIAERCGFQDMSYFTKAFREVEGCPPSEYRRQRRQGSDLPKNAQISCAMPN